MVFFVFVALIGLALLMLGLFGQTGRSVRTQESAGWAIAWSIILLLIGACGIGAVLVADWYNGGVC